MVASTRSPAACSALIAASTSGCDDDRHGEDAARRSAQAFAVVRVDAVADEHHRAGTHGIGDADQGARVARFTDFHADGDQSGRAQQNLRKTGLGSSQTATKPAGVTVSDKAFAARSVTSWTDASCASQQRGVPLRGRLGDENLADQSAPRGRFDQVGAFDQKYVGYFAGPPVGAV